MDRLHAVAGLLLMGAALPAWAEVVTDGTVGPRVRLGGDFEIGADLGRRAGRNLFHSFARFSLATGERATFSGPEPIRNVISRVTGPMRSEIDGTIASTIPGADLYLINPAGVVFGPNARLEVQGSFHVSTADELRFADGARFSASEPAASSFTVAAPEAFGFVGDRAQALQVSGARLTVPAGAALSLIGGKVVIRGDEEQIVRGVEELPVGIDLGGLFLSSEGQRLTVRSQGPTLIAGAGALISAPGGRVAIAAIGRAAEVGIAEGEVPDEAAADVVIAGQVLVDSTGDGGGGIRIDGRRVSVADQSMIVAANNGSANPAGDLMIDAASLEVTGRSVIAAFAGSSDAIFNVPDGFDPEGADLIVRAGRLILAGHAVVGTGTFSLRNAGAVRVSARDGVLRGASALTSESEFFGNAGDIVVDSGTFEVVGGSAVSSRSAIQGQAGNITIEARRSLTVRGTAADGRPSRLVADNDRPVTTLGARAGSVTVVADSVVVADGAEITARNVGGGPGGRILLDDARVVVIDDGSLIAEATEDGFGEIIIRSGELVALHDATLSATATGDVPTTAGSVTISRPNVIVIDDSTITASAPFGTGGNITLVAGDRLQSPGSRIEASGLELGTIEITTRDQDVAGQLAILENDLIDAGSLLRERCASRRDIGASSFAGVGRPGLPPSPDRPLASPQVGRDGPAGAPLRPTAASSAGRSAAPPGRRAPAALAPCLPGPARATGSP